MRTITLAATALVVLLSSADAQQVSAPVVHPPANPVQSSVNDLQNVVAAPSPVWQPGDPVRVERDLEGRAGHAPAAQAVMKSIDPLLRAARSHLLSATPAGTATAAAIGVNHDGIGSTGVLPPDPVGAVGPNHYIQMVNSKFAIYDKNLNRLAGPSDIKSLWKGFGGPCENQNDGDPVARYDHLADRWLISQFQLDQHMQCIAISRSNDPVKGGWFLYGFQTVDGNGNAIQADYPKIGVWPDGYYMSTQRGFPSEGIDVWVFERDKMLEGQPARQVQFSVAAPSIVMLPSHLSGPAPPAGTPNFFIRPIDGHRFGGQDRIEVYAFSVNWPSPEKSTFALASTLPTAPFNSILCTDDLMDACIPQPGTDVKLESLSVWPMFPAHFRSFTDREVLLLNHTVNADGNGRAGIRWYELRRPHGGNWSIFQQNTYSPDTAHRWMGGLAMDQAGNMAVAYSVSSTQTFPSIRASFRSATSPTGVLANEARLVDGRGSQTFSDARWGDYISIDVDPANPCSFWVTGLYYAETSDAGWHTRITQMQPPGFASDCRALVPSLGGLTLTDARLLLQKSGLTLGKVENLPAETGSGKLSAPLVVNQSLESGTAAKTSDHVDIVLQKIREQ